MKKILVCSNNEGVRESVKLLLSETHPLILTDCLEGICQILENSKDVRLVLIDMDKQKKVNTFIDEISSRSLKTKIKFFGKEKPKNLDAKEFLFKPLKQEQLLKYVGL